MTVNEHLVPLSQPQVMECEVPLGSVAQPMIRRGYLPYVEEAKARLRS